MGGLSVDIPVGTVRRALAIAELSGSDTVSITISLERLVDLMQTVAGLVGQRLDEAVVQENMSSDVEPGDGSENRGAAASAALPVSPVADEQGPTGRWSRGRRYIFCRNRFLLQNAGPQTTRRRSGRTDGFRCSDDLGNICMCIRKEVGSGSGCCGGTSGEAGDSRGETCYTQTQQCFHWRIEEARSGRAGSMNANYDPQVRSFPLQ